MAKTLVDIDDELLAEATRALGTTTKKDTLNAALTKVVEEARARRLHALEELRKAADDGVFDFDRLNEVDE